MNCLDVRRQLTTDPIHRSQEIDDHLEGCASCASFSRDLLDFDATVKKALHVDVPEGLAHRVLLAQNLGENHLRQNRRQRLYAVAASLTLAVGLTSGLVFFNQPYSLDQVALNHVKDERHHLEDRKNIQLAQLNGVLKPFNLQFDNQIGTINYAGTCKIRNSTGVHVVVQGKSSVATLLLMPGEYVSQRQEINDPEFRGLIVPTQNGSVAIISDEKDEITRIEEKLKESIRIL